MARPLTFGDSPWTCTGVGERCVAGMRSGLRSDLCADVGVINGERLGEEGSDVGGVEGVWRDVRRCTPRNVVRIWIIS